MVDDFIRLGDDHLFFLTVLASLLTAMTTVLGGIAILQFRRYRQRQLELGFREDMLNRGLSVDEVVRLMTAARPTWVESAMTCGDWMIGNLSLAIRSTVSAVQRLLRTAGVTVQPILVRGWRSAVELWCNSARWRNQVARRARHRCAALWRETKPVLSTLARSVNRCVQWAGNITERLVRQLAPQRP